MMNAPDTIGANTIIFRERTHGVDTTFKEHMRSLAMESSTLKIKSKRALLIEPMLSTCASFMRLRLIWSVKHYYLIGQNQIYKKQSPFTRNMTSYSLN